MRKYLVLLFLQFYILSSFAQLAMYKRFDELLSNIKKANKVIFQVTYLGDPLVLTFYFNEDHKDFAKTFMFDKKVCFYEHHTYPLSQFENQKMILDATYGTPFLNNSGGTITYNYVTNNGLVISLAKKILSIQQKVGVSIVIMYEKDTEKLINATQKLQSGLTVSEFL